LLILTLSASPKVAARDVIDRYGRPVGIDTPQPDAPPDLPVYYAYRIAKAKVSFGITQSEPRTVVTVVVDRSAQ
jgi:hypothetical protein